MFKKTESWHKKCLKKTVQREEELILKCISARSIKKGLVIQFRQTIQ